MPFTFLRWDGSEPIAGVRSSVPYSGAWVRPALCFLDIPERLSDFARHLDVEDFFLVVVVNQGAPECDESIHLGDELRFEVLRVPARCDFPFDAGALIFNLAE